MDQLFSLLQGDSSAPDAYVSHVAEMKRFMEAFTADPRTREAFAADPSAALRDLNLSQLSPADAEGLLDQYVLGTTLKAVLTDKAVDPSTPLAVVRYCAFIAEKVRLRSEIFRASEPTNKAMATWWRRQVNRCAFQFGAAKASGMVHSPLIIELSSGCSVGCWFCGLAAKPYSGYFPHTDHNGQFWRECLDVFRGVIGPAAGEGVLYWATEPLDNPDYELFVQDYYSVMNRWPQTTTAAALRDVGRTRRLLNLGVSHGGLIDRFSVLSVAQLRDIHSAFTPEELLRVECIPQYRGATMIKTRVGRAAAVTDSRSNQVAGSDFPGASSIACASGFLANMSEKSLKLITPCDASSRWPLGYWVVAESTFDSPETLEATLLTMIDRCCVQELPTKKTISLYPNVIADSRKPENELVMRADTGVVTVQCLAADSDRLVDTLARGTETLASLAASNPYSDNEQVLSTWAVLRKMYRQGLLDEEPDVSSGVRAEETHQGYQHSADTTRRGSK